MKSATLPFLLALGLVAPTAFAADANQPTANQPGANQQGTSGGYGLSSGASGGMRSEAGAGIESAPAYIDMPQPQTRGDITYLCGGIGKTEAAYMNQQARDYDLKLTFAAQSGAYLADVDVDISRANGESVLQANCDGPIMLVDVARSGTYRIRADADGFIQTRTARVNAGRTQTASNVVVTWPRNAVAQMQPSDEPLATGGGNTDSNVGAGAGGGASSGAGGAAGQTQGTR